MIKWAIANGNWNAGATWNDGVVPVDGDYVYCNGYTVNPNVNFNLPNSTISNCANTEYNIMGGGHSMRIIEHQHSQRKNTKSVLLVYFIKYILVVFLMVMLKSLVMGFFVPSQAEIKVIRGL